MDNLKEQGKISFQQFLNKCQQAGLKPYQVLNYFDQDIYLIWALCPFFSTFANRYPQAFFDLVYSQDMFDTSYQYVNKHWQKLAQLIASNPPEDEFNRYIRVYRQQECARIAWQHFNHHIHNRIYHTSYPASATCFQRLTYELTTLAKSLIETVHQYCHFMLCQKMKMDPETTPALIIVGMGKLGADELNFSSDIDLIFFYNRQKDMINQDHKPITAFKFYTRLGQYIINTLHQLKPSGFVYRVDMRLRPFGHSGPIAMSLNAFDNYCFNHGRAWERYAFVKSGIITGDKKDTKKLKRIINHFVYRQYHDYKMTDSIRNMKTRIIKEMKKIANDIKLGRGGIREIEFIVQCYQLIYGGQNRFLRTKHLKTALFNLADYERLSRAQANHLYQLYVFLRDIENTLQMLNDQQTHQLPQDATRQNSLIIVFGFDKWSTLISHIESNRKQVQTYFDQLTHFDKIDNPTTNHDLDASNKPLKSQPGQPYQSGENKARSTEKQKVIQQMIDDFKAKIQQNNFTDESVALVTKILPSIQKLIDKNPQWRSEWLLSQVLHFLKTIMKRPTYLYLLYDHMHQLENWLAIINLGEFFAYELIQHAYLIERALQPRSRERIYISCEKYYTRLKRYINQVEADNKEALLEAIRRFQIAQLFNISVARSTNKINLMEASDVICYLAESIIPMVTKLAFDDVLPKFNLTESQKSQIRNHFAVIAYGKLGGLEMDLTSDLDLIFLYHCPSDIDDPLAIYSRVVQKFNNIMQSPSYSGKLYDIDLRLRPDGTSGLLVSSIEAYQRYQHYSAWTWEHQALVRARWITGSENYIKPRFEKLRQNILNRPRDQRQLQHQIVNMRKKMQRQLIKTKQFDLKQSPGGLIDIEFLAQYFALYYGYRYPQISLFTDNIRIFHSMETAQILSKHECDTLIAIYCSYRSWIYERFVSKQSQHIPFDQIARNAETIQTIWQKWLWY